jgi:hypothetical protein
MKIIIKHSLFFFVFLLLFAINSVLPFPIIGHALVTDQPAKIEDINPKCYSLDVVFLIDQSGSMKQNDPDLLRKDAVEWVVNWLGDNVLSSCPDATHRIAIVAWGETAEIVLDGSRIISPRTDQQGRIEWRTERDDLKRQIEEYFGTIGNERNLQDNTDPKVAFDEARKILAEFQSEPLGDLPRKRVIIFLTDGIPASPKIDDVVSYSADLVTRTDQIFPFDSSLLQRERCLFDALERAKESGLHAISAADKNDCLGNNPVGESAYNESVYIWSILLNINSQDYQYETFRGAMKKIAQDHAGILANINQNVDIPAQFLDIMTSLVGVRAERLGCQSFAMEPYLQQATLSFFKIESDISVEISYQNGNQTYTITQDDVENNTTWPLYLPGFIVKDYTNDNGIERYVFSKPQAGEWNIRAPVTSNCKGIQAFFEPLDFAVKQISPLSTVPQYDLSPFYDASSPSYIVYRLVNREYPDETIEPNPQYPLTVTAILTLPNGEVMAPVDLIYEGGVYKSPDPLKVNVVGQYQLTVNGTTRFVDTRIKEKRVLFEEVHFFEVIPVTPFQIKIIEPRESEEKGALETYQLHGSLLTGLRTNPIELRIILTDRDGNRIEPSQVLLKPDTVLQGVIFYNNVEVAKVNFSRDSERPDELVGQVTSLREEGDYHLAVSVVEPSDGTSPYVALFRPDNKIVERDFSVRDTLWTRPLTYNTMGILMVLVLIVGIITTAVRRNNPVTGTLVFEVGTTHIADIQIGTGWNVSTISRRTLQAYSTLGLKSLKVNKSKEQLGCVDYYAVDMNGNPYSGTLMPESTTPFAGGMTVRYEPLESQ